MGTGPAADVLTSTTHSEIHATSVDLCNMSTYTTVHIFNLTPSTGIWLAQVNRCHNLFHIIRLFICSNISRCNSNKFILPTWMFSCRNKSNNKNLFNEESITLFLNYIIKMTFYIKVSITLTYKCYKSFAKFL